MTLAEFLMEHLDKLPADDRFVLLRGRAKDPEGRRSLTLGVSKTTRDFLHQEADKFSEALTARYKTPVKVTIGAVVDWLVSEALPKPKRARSARARGGSCKGRRRS